jgi:hypothetical protein
MVKEIGYEAAAAVIERFKPRAVASPSGAGNGSGNGAAPLTETGIAIQWPARSQGGN